VIFLFSQKQKKMVDVVVWCGAGKKNVKVHWRQSRLPVTAYRMSPATPASSLTLLSPCGVFTRWQLTHAKLTQNAFSLCLRASKSFFVRPFDYLALFLFTFLDTLSSLVLRL
jgi:hypothetical protein